GGGATDAVGGGEGQVVGPAAPRGRRAAERGRAVAVGDERHPAGQGARLAQARGWRAAGRYREAARRAHREGGVVGAGDGRRLVDREGEGLGGGAAHAVGGGEGEGVRADGPRRRGAAERGRAVLVVGERRPAGQGTALGQRRGREAGGRYREAARRAHREGGVVGAGDGRRLGRPVGQDLPHAATVGAGGQDVEARHQFQLHDLRVGQARAEAGPGCSDVVGHVDAHVVAD